MALALSKEVSAYHTNTWDMFVALARQIPQDHALTGEG